MGICLPYHSDGLLLPCSNRFLDDLSAGCMEKFVKRIEEIEYQLVPDPSKFDGAGFETGAAGYQKRKPTDTMKFGDGVRIKLVGKRIIFAFFNDNTPETEQNARAIERS